MEIYSEIDMKRTGERIKMLIAKRGLRISDIQKQLYLSCPQPVYRWMKGQILPSVNHLFTLSKILGVHMEDLIVEKGVGLEVEFGKIFVWGTRVYVAQYYEKLKHSAV